MENSNYIAGKKSFSPFLIRLVGWPYCFFMTKKMNLKVKDIQGKIPDKGGILIACHHEDDADPFVVKKAVKRRLHWMAATRIAGKSILDRPILKKILDLLGFLSIDADRPERNKGLFDYIAYIISIGEAVIIFPEGNLRNQRKNRIGQAKNGVIRIAQHAQQKYGRDVPVYPIGIRYERTGKRKDGYIKIGKPMFFGSSENPKIGIKRLMKNISRLS
jgi:1-acyl-sn-glycerol-3-phosphate acyltransferase